MTERLLAALTDNGKWLEGFTPVSYTHLVAAHGCIVAAAASGEKQACRHGHGTSQG